MRRMLLSGRILFSLFFAVVLFLGTVSAQTTIFKRLGVIQPRPQDPEGFGNIVVGDVTGSGTAQIYAVSGEILQSSIIPRMYEYNYNSTTNTFDSVWASVAPLPDQNTWCPLTIADLDGDGHMEVVWGPVNAGASGANPIRLLDYEAKVTDGSSPELGLPNGAGGDSANASWTMTDSLNYNSRPFRWVTADINNDGRQELVFCTRAGGYVFGVISVDNIPDAPGDPAANWTMDTSGIGLNMAIGQSYKDIAVIDSTIYLINLSGDMQPVYYANGTYTVGKLYSNVVPGGDWKSAQVVDLDGNGQKEIIVGAWSGSSVYLLQPAGDSLSTTKIADFASLGCSRLNGSAMGDFNGDGHMDFAFGSRSGYATPDASIYMLAYEGGDITSSASYKTSIADSMAESNVQWDALSSGKIDGDASTDELVYSGVPRYNNAPIVVLNKMTTNNTITPLSTVVMDADHNYVPDDSGATVTVIGTVNGANPQGSAHFSYTIQDGSSGIQLFDYNHPGPALSYGTRVMATGTVTQYNGLNELDLDVDTALTVIDSNRVINPHKLTLESYLDNPEPYENTLVEVDGLAKTSTSAAWPSAGSDANMTVWDGYKSITMRLDKDTEIPGQPEPQWPINLVAVASQYTSSTPANSGYQLIPSFYSQFTQNVAVAPTPYFFLQSPADSAVISITDSSQTLDLSWTHSVDLNGDAIGYAFEVIGGTPIGLSSDTSASIPATTLLGLMGASDTLSAMWTIVAKSSTNSDPLVASVDTFYVTVINNIVTTGIQSKNIPTQFYVDQNYPNPFNPTTTIRFGLARSQNVDLRVYNILGQQVAVLINNQTRPAGDYHVVFNATNLASGTYIFRLVSGSKIVTKKMLLLK